MPTFAQIKANLQAALDKGNAKTGANDATITACIDRLVESSGGGGVQPPTEGIAYTLLSGGASFRCDGIGTATDTDIIIGGRIGSIGVTEIADKAFEKNNTITSVEMSDDVARVGTAAFSECAGLTKVTIGKGVREIGATAFYNCTALTGVYIKDIDGWCRIVFSSNAWANPLNYARRLYLNGAELKDLVVPDGIEALQERSFYYCSSIQSATIPASVKEIKASAFNSCGNLRTVTFKGAPDTIATSAFNYGGVTDIYVPWAEGAGPEGAPWGATRATIHYNS